MRQTIAILVLNTVIQMHESYIYIYIYTVLGFIVPFEYFYCKKGSGFEIVENKCIFVHQSYSWLLFQSLFFSSFLFALSSLDSPFCI